MAKKKNRKETEPASIKLKDETVSWIFAVSFFVLFIIFILAPIGLAGRVGNKIYEWLKILFGLGYFLLPLLSIMLSISFAKSIKHSFGTTRAIGASIFFLSSLALLDLTFDKAFGVVDKGGLVGKFLHGPLIKLFDVPATAVILSALVVISLLVIFDAVLNLSSIFNLFRKNKEEEILTI